MEVIFENLINFQFMTSLLFAVAATASVASVLLPMITADPLDARMKSVVEERARIRERERERLKNGAKGLRDQPKPFIKQIVDNLSLSKWLGTDGSVMKLAQAGYRGPRAEVTFLFSRLITPAAMFVGAGFYLLFLASEPYPFTINVGILLAALLIGIKLPEIFLKNTTDKRRANMRRAFPDAMDLLLICVESGMSIEHSFNKVAQEIGISSPPLSEEFTLTMAELSYLPDRRSAYENMALRIGLDPAKQIATVLIQAEKYGTPLGQALRVVSEESRTTRITEAEKKAASLPPMLTVPMILFFLPVLFAVILTPAIIKATNAFQ